MDLLINWLWQTALFVLLVGLALAPWRGMSAAMRYAVWSVALALVILIPLRALLEPASGSWFPPAAAGVGSSVESLSSMLPSLPAFPSWMTVVAVCLWIEWAAFSGVRLARAVLALADTRRACLAFPADRAERLPLWQRLGRDRRCVSLALSSRVRGAAVLGGTRPIIAISPVLASGLSDEELDQVIVHELAHVHRRDDIAALGQALVDVVAGFHPAVRAVQSRLHLEREMACDDWVVRVTGSSKRYASCLTHVAALQEPGVDLLAPAALAPAQLTLRITRLLDRRRSRARASQIGLLAATPALVALALGVEGFSLESPGASSSGEQVVARSASPAAVRPAITEAQPVVVRAVASGGDAGPAGKAFGSRTGVRPSARRSHPAGASQPTARPPSAQAASDEPRSAPGDVVPAALIDVRTPSVIDAYPATVEASAALDDQSGVSPLLTAPWRAPVEAGVVIGQASVTAGASIGEASANTGVAIGQGTQKAAVATAGLFSRMGKSMGRVF